MSHDNPEQNLRNEARILATYGLQEMADTLLLSIDSQNWQKIRELADDIAALPPPSESKHYYATIMAAVIHTNVYELEHGN